MEQSSKDIHPQLHLKEMIFAALKKKDYGEIGKQVLEQSEKSGRNIEITGEVNLPAEGPYILASNHYVRVTNREEMTGPQKTNDAFISHGLMRRLVEKHTPSARALHITGSLPRPEALLPKNKNISELLAWLKKDAKFSITNMVVSVFLGTMHHTDDLVTMPHPPYTWAGMPEAKAQIENHLKNKNVLIIFPEGEVSQELREAKNGMGYFAKTLEVPVIPVSTYDQNGTLKVIIGQPIMPSEAADRFQLTDLVMKRIASNLPEELRGRYGEPVADNNAPAHSDQESTVSQ